MANKGAETIAYRYMMQDKQLRLRTVICNYEVELSDTVRIA